MKYPSLKWQWIFVLIITCSCFPFITNKTFIGLESVTRQLSIPGITYSSRAAVNTRNYLLFTSSCQYQELLTLHEQLSIPGLTYTSRAAINTRNYLHFTSSCQYQELLTLHEQLSIPGITYTSRAAVNTRNYLYFTSTWIQHRFFMGSVLLISLVSGVVIFFILPSSFCILYPMLPASLTFPFLLAPSGFSNFYWELHEQSAFHNIRSWFNIHLFQGVHYTMQQFVINNFPLLVASRWFSPDILFSSIDKE
jgi:hypothetical protein